MLVLSRKENERIMIGPGITVTVVAIERGKVRIGIEAPRDIDIQREELVRNPSVPMPLPKKPTN